MKGKRVLRVFQFACIATTALILFAFKFGFMSLSAVFSAEFPIGFISGVAFSVLVYLLICWIDPSSRPRGRS
ncbi:MAG: hypothetical protein BGO05_16025 [Rhizobiales bacterium 63-7]|nr:MAG: hypothetical protein BGO05_16025 [Rhizobiales bacterium 63-7]